MGTGRTNAVVRFDLDRTVGSVPTTTIVTFRRVRHSSPGPYLSWRHVAPAVPSTPRFNVKVHHVERDVIVVARAFRALPGGVAGRLSRHPRRSACSRRGPD